jgi:hypothetical protein
MRKLAFLIAAFASIAMASQAFSGDAAAGQESPAKPLMLITWFGPGGIPLPEGKNWKPELLTVYDKGTRPVAQFSDNATRRSVSFILFENLSGTPTAQGCRQDGIDPIVKNEGKLISGRVDGEMKNSAGDTLATTSYVLDLSKEGLPHQPNLFGFAGNAKTCAEIHISSVVNIPAEQDALKAEVAGFKPDLNYQPGADDYFRLASALFEGAPGLAAPYYKSSLDALPDDSRNTPLRRIATDQLVMSLGMSGDLKNSRAVAEKAVIADPDYPLNYYNLACADAEEGKASDARIHLQQAFDRRANVLKGESMPDPSKDDSLLKLKKNKEFWAFVLALPKN